MIVKFVPNYHEISSIVNFPLYLGLIKISSLISETANNPNIKKNVINHKYSYDPQRYYRKSLITNGSVFQMADERFIE